jgi:ChrR Cupin-like domain
MRSVCLLIFVLFISAFTFAQTEQTQPASMQADHKMISPKEMQWQESEFPGVSVAVVDGNPAEAGSPFTIWLKLPPNYRFAPHWHPTDESLVVISGSIGLGVGDKLDMKSGRVMGPGSFGKMNKEVHHYAWTSKGCTFALYGMGPFQTTFVNPADDPRTKK